MIQTGIPPQIEPDADGRSPIYRGYDRDGLEAQYNLRPRHPERTSVYANYAKKSIETRAKLDGSCDIRYGPAERQVLDIFPAQMNAPVLLFFHGGYWRALDKSIFSYIAEPYVKAGWTVVLSNYTLAPAVGIDAIVEEARQAVYWVTENILPTGQPLVVSGHSAGGHLTVMSMLTDWTIFGMEHSPVAGGIPISGIFDLEPIRHTSINSLVRLSEDQAIRNSPAIMPLVGREPLLVIVGGAETEEFQGQSTRFAQSWEDASSPSKVIVAEGQSHFSVIGDFAHAETELFHTVLEFLSDF